MRNRFVEAGRNARRRAAWCAVAAGVLLLFLSAAAHGADYKDSKTGMEFVLVKGGCYRMGNAFEGGYKDEKPVHPVCVGDFYLGEFPVTQGQWRAVMGNNPSQFRKGDAYPVENVSWNDVQAFIRKLNGMTGKKYRLPTEAEWEYAARSGGKNEKWSGTSAESALGEFAWYDRNSGNETHPVGLKKPNGLGLYDMSGNVWEWVNDWYKVDYYESSPRDNPQGPPAGDRKVLRGGGWISIAANVRAARRLAVSSTDRMNFFGFRLALPAR